MDRDEVARRLARIREAVREELERRPADEDAPASEPFELPAGVGLILRGEPPLGATPYLDEANRAADVSGPVDLRSRRPVVGFFLTLARKLLRPFVQPLIDAHVERQQAFNDQVVRHLNELGERLEGRVRAIEEALIEWSADPGGIDGRLQRALEDYDAALRRRHTVLFATLEEEIAALQTLGADALRRRSEEMQEQRTLLETLSDQVAARVEAVDARFEQKDREMKQALSRLRRPASELLAMRSLLQSTIEQARDVRDEASAVDSESGPEVGGDAADADGGWKQLTDWMSDEDYRAFQDAFRGDSHEIEERLRGHVERFAGAPGPVADLGCGRGEFLDLLAEADHERIGVELNAADVEECRSRGHEAVEADLFSWLEEREEASLGGIFAAQVIEHLPPRSWQRLVRLAITRLAPGGRLVIETINPESLYALARAYVVDPTHVRPVHPQLLSFLAQRAGFEPVEIELQAPVPEQERPAGLAVDAFEGEPTVQQLAAMVRERLGRVDRICCAPQEYTLDARRPAGGAS